MKTEKQSLNGKYCLATKENYDQLVKDGYAVHKRYYNYEYIAIHKRYIILTDDYDGNYSNNSTPMHYNKEKECWVIGSLETEEATKCIECGDELKGHEDDSSTTCRWCVSGWKAEPKQTVDRITREEAKDSLYRFVNAGMTMKNVTFINEIDLLFDYVENLESTIDKFKMLAFELNTIEWSKHRKTTNIGAWNLAIDSVRKEILKHLEANQVKDK